MSFQDLAQFGPFGGVHHQRVPELGPAGHRPQGAPSARPADRDPVDARIVKSVRDRTGNIINCVAANGTTRCQRNGGGWPSLAENKQALTLPANPNEVGADGYTNLEKWLHKMASKVEGSSPIIKAPKVSLD